MTDIANIYNADFAEEAKQVMSTCRQVATSLKLVGESGTEKLTLAEDFCREYGLGTPLCMVGSMIGTLDANGFPAICQSEIEDKKDSYRENGNPQWQDKILKGEHKVLFLNADNDTCRHTAAGMTLLAMQRKFGNGEQIPEDCLIILSNTEQTMFLLDGIPTMHLPSSKPEAVNED